MKWFVMSFLVMLVSGCDLDGYDNGYQHHPRAHVYPSRDYHGNRDNHNRPQHGHEPVTHGHRGQPSRPHPQPSNQHGHDDSNQHGHGSVPGYSGATPSVQNTTVHNHP